jgi:hypothetical protein
VLKAGISEVDITPPVGLPMGGYKADGSVVSTDIASPLYARVMVLDDGRHSVAVVATDLLAVEYSTTIRVRELVQEKTLIPGKNVMICGTHTHKGPVTHRRFGKMDVDLTESLAQKIADAVEMGWNRRQEASVGMARTTVNRITYNRRKKLPDGSVCMLWDSKEDWVKIHYESTDRPQDVGLIADHCPDGLVDNEIVVLVLRDPRDRIFGGMVNFACHPIAFGGMNDLRYSADFPGFVVEEMKRKKGIEIVYTNGAGADINPIAGGSSLEEAQRIGTLLAAGVIGSLDNIKYCNKNVVNACSETVELSLKSKPTLQEARKMVEERAMALEKATRDGECAGKLQRLDEEMRLGEYFCRMWDVMGPELRKGQMRSEVQAISINGIILVGLPGEPFVEIGLKIKERTSQNTAVVIGYANDYVGYIATNEAYAEGGYEPVWNILAPGAGERITDVASGLIEKLSVGG